MDSERKNRLEQAIKHLMSLGLIDGRAISKSIAERMDRGVNGISSALNGDERYLTWKFTKAFCASFSNIISAEWIYDGSGKMIVEETHTTKMLPSDFDNLPSKGFDKSVGKPYFNVDFEMGYTFMENDQTRTPDYMIDFTPYNKCDCWCNAHGDSMRPTISSGDVIAIKEIKDFSCLISGEIYAIITTNELRTIKRIKDNGDTVTLIPDNKEYPEQVIKKSIIYKVFRVLGSMKMF